jgi:sugar lactone lactonase YvrE
VGNPIETIAGGTGYGRAGQGGRATAAQLRHPSGVVADRAGAVYIADSNSGAIRVVDPDGGIRTIAGDHGDGYAGDGGQALDARFSKPTMVVLDEAGNLFVADRDNHAIRRVDLDGVVTTVAGGNGEGATGDGGPATQAQLNCPRGLAIDGGGSLYFTDRDNHSVRRVDPSGVITTITASRGSRLTPWKRPVTLRRPRGLAFDAADDLYVADRNNHAIRRIDRRGVMTTFAGGNGEGYSGDGGPATRAQFRYPSGIVFDRDGNAFVSDHLNHAIRKIDPAGVITTVVGGNGAGYTGDGGEALAAQIEYPSGLALDAEGNLYIADRNNDAVRKVAGLGVVGEPPGLGGVRPGSTGDG